jgi:ribose transport system ATP-binding protein
MKKELFALEEAAFKENDKEVIRGLTMHLYEKDIYGIICDSIDERDALLNFFKGRCELSRGRMRLRHNLVKNGNVSQSLGREFAVIEKKSKLLTSLSVMENICIFADRDNIVRKRKYYGMTRKYLEYFDIAVPPDKPVQSLSVKERVAVELVKSYVENKSVIVLADLTGFLQENELIQIYRLLLKLQQKGQSFILMETLDDIVFSWTNQLLIIKNGKNLGCFEPAFVDRQTLYAFLSGRQEAERPREVRHGLERKAGTDDRVFRMEKVCTPNLKNLSFSAGRGEVVKIFFANAGNVEDFREIFMDGSRITSGAVYVEERPVRCRNIREWRRRGLRYSAEMPYKSMLIRDMTVVDNFMLELAEKVRFLWLLPRYKRSVYQYIDSILGEGMANRKLRNLSPDVLQKIGLGKYYLAAPKVLICENPFQEVDLHIREVTLEMFAKLRERGIAIIALITNLSDMNLMEGSNIYIRNGDSVEESEIYPL